MGAFGADPRDVSRVRRVVPEEVEAGAVVAAEAEPVARPQVVVQGAACRPAALVG